MRITQTAAVSLILLLSQFTQAVPLINGVSIHSELGQESFIGALFTETLSDNARGILVAQEEKQLQVRILANRISSRRFKRLWIEGLAINASASELEKQAGNMAKFSNLLKVTLKKGDIFSIQRTNENVKVVINGTTLGVINDTKFFDLLLRTWIGPVPLSSSFRAQLLVAGELDSQLADRFNNTKPSDTRIAAVAAALSKSKSAADKNTTTSKAVAAAKPKVSAPKVKAPTLVKPPIVVAVPDLPSKSTALKTTDVAPKQPIKKPTKAPIKVAIAPTPKPEPKEEPILDDIIEEDDEEFTAESLLAQQLYIAKLKKWTYREIRYPEESILADESGIVRMRVTISRKGKVREIDMLEEPEFDRLTKAAVTAVKKSQPYPNIPDDIKGKEFSFTLPIVFRLVDE